MTFSAARGAKSHFVAEKRLSKEFDCTIGVPPATRLLCWGAAGAALAVADASVTDGFSGGRVGLASACRVSGFCAFGSGLAAVLVGFAAASGGACVEAVVSALAPPMPTLRARLEKKPSDCCGAAAACCAGAADAYLVLACAGAAGAGAPANAGSSGC